MRLIQKQLHDNYNNYDSYYQYTQDYDDPLRQTITGLHDYDMFADMSSEDLSDYITDNFGCGHTVSLD